MNLRQIPIVPTIVVVVAAGIMVWLGIWQLGRAEWKAELKQTYASSLANDEKLSALPATRHQSRWELFRLIELSCEPVIEWRSTAARNNKDQLGYAQIAKCEDKTRFAFGGEGAETSYFEAIVGWSRAPQAPEWSGGMISGRLVSADKIPKVQSISPVSGLEPLASPDPNNLPDNHLAYAGQWFFFALTALVIYWFAIQGRLKERREDEA